MVLSARDCSSYEPLADYLETSPSPSETAHALCSLSCGDSFGLTLHDGRQITATVSEGPYYTSPSWPNGERETGGFGLVAEATEADSYRWLHDEQNGRIEISADEHRGWEPPFASTWRTYDPD